RTAKSDEDRMVASSGDEGEKIRETRDVSRKDDHEDDYDETLSMDGGGDGGDRDRKRRRSDRRQRRGRHYEDYREERDGRRSGDVKTKESEKVVLPQPPLDDSEEEGEVR
ncbi:hypothetical protein HK102_011274, partial [Quaeritorhiza haematococci]